MGGSGLLDRSGRPPGPVDPRGGGSAIAFWLLFAAFVGLYSLVLASLPYTIDEGVNIQYARLILEGERPYADFFYHQLPLQLYLFATLAPIAPDSLFLYRFPSLLAVAGTGWAVYRIALRVAPAPAAVLAAGLYYATPLQYHGMLAIPNGPQMFFSALAVYLVIFHDDRRRVILGGVALVVAVLVKPLALATIGVIGTVLLFDRAQRWKLLPVGLVGVLGAFLSWLVLHWTSDGYFTRLIGLLLHPDFAQAIYDAWGAFPIVAGEFERLGIRSFTSWNLWLHVSTARDWGAATVLVTAAALGGWVVVLRHPGLLPRRVKILLAAWFVFPFLFAIYVWKPAFNSYHRQYLASFVILAAIFLWRLWESGRRSRRALVATWLALIVSLCAIAILSEQRDYGRLRAMDLRGEPLFTMDPFVNFLTGSAPACGLTDPMARVPLSYGSPDLLAQLERDSVLEVVRPQMMIDCLERSPETRILISTVRFFPLFFMNDELYRYIRAQDEERLSLMSETDRRVLRDLFE